MKNYLLLITIFAGIRAFAQDNGREQDMDKYIQSDIVPMMDKKGFSFQTKAGDFMIKPYTLVQSAAKFNYYDDEGLELSDQDNVANSGFEIPYAVLGVSGRAFGKLTFNLTVNAAKSGDALLQQAWFDVNLKDELRFRAGKFKTPYNQAYLVTLGETLFPALPVSLTASVYIDRSLNSVPPTFATGFDLGVMVHGLLKNKWEYNLGIFNGTGIAVNTARKTLSDDLGIPSLLYAARLAFMPKGAMPLHQGNTNDLNNDKFLVAVSASYNVEANWQTSNDLRLGLELSYIKNRLYLSGEAYYMNVDFVKRQKVSANYNFIGGYIQGGYFVTNKLQPALRYDFMDRNSLDTKGILNLPAVGLNYYLFGYNLKLQAMYQFLGRWGHENQDARDLDDLGLSEHSAVLMLQLSF
ncbi:MAG: OprO/OprP family phosphate-selective porin [Prevotellaceae bacterium]|nr:OprO/OprP family phosphate-selective porin [Prevotellaceae bacterium]